MAEPYISIVERLFGIARTLNLTTILMIALLLMLAVPTYFAWRFLTNEDFRREFMQSAELLTEHAPCVVLEGHAYGHATRHTIMVVYELDGRFEKILGRRASGKLTKEELNSVCQIVLSDAGRLNQNKEAVP